MGKQDDYDYDNDAAVSVHSVDGPWTPNRSRTWGNDVMDAEGTRPSRAWTWGLRNGWRATRRRVGDAVKPVVAGGAVQALVDAVLQFVCSAVWPFLVRVFTAGSHWLALGLFLAAGVVPLAVLGYFTPMPLYPNGFRPYYGVFAAKSMTCGNEFSDKPVNSTVEGMEALFVLDKTWGQYSFATVKTIDVAWDILFGRGVQMVAWWAGYVVFSAALLRVIERHPASFRIFQRIALEGPSLLSLWTLVSEVWSASSKRTKALFAYMLLSTAYILCIPMFLGAMTGYDSTSIAWTDLDDTNNIVPTSAVESSWIVTGTTNSTFDKPVCEGSTRNLRAEYTYPRMSKCTCQMPNGTFAPPNTFVTIFGNGLLQENRWAEADYTQCLFNYPGANGTWEERKYDPENYNRGTGKYNLETRICNETVTQTLNGHPHDVQTLLGEWGYCYNARAYSYTDLAGKSRCLPDTANPSYQWGFSTMLSGIFVFINFGWCASMYVLWLDTRARSVLVRHHRYALTPLRAAFVVTAVVRERLVVGERELVRWPASEVDAVVDGRGDVPGTCIAYEVFAGDGGGGGGGAGADGGRGGEGGGRDQGRGRGGRGNSIPNMPTTHEEEGDEKPHIISRRRRALALDNEPC